MRERKHQHAALKKHAECHPPDVSLWQWGPHTEGPHTHRLLQNSMSPKEETTKGLHVGTAYTPRSPGESREGGSTQSGLPEKSFVLGQGLPVTVTWRTFEKPQWPGQRPKSTTSEPRRRGWPGASICKGSPSSEWEGEVGVIIAPAPSVSQLVKVG